MIAAVSHCLAGLLNKNWSAANGGLRDGGISNPRISNAKGFFPPFSGFPVMFGPSGKG